MSRRYTPKQKADALQHLDDNYGNVPLTALQTSIPERTLRDWKRLRKLETLKQLPPKKVAQRQQQKEYEEEDTTAAYTRIRAHLMQHINTLLDTLTDDPDTANLRAIALTRLLDRTIKLEAFVQNETDHAIRIEYQYPDGSIHTAPPWETNWDAEDQPPPLTMEDVLTNMERESDSTHNTALSSRSGLSQ